MAQGQFVRIKLSRWLEQNDDKPWPDVERAHAAGMVGRVTGLPECKIERFVRVEWLNPEPGTSWAVTEATPEFFQPLSPLEMLARCESLGCEIPE